MKNKILAALTLATPATFTGCGPASNSRSGNPEKPNIIFVLADDLGYGDLGCYGQKEIKTPNLDRLAEEGIRFTQFYSGSPVCAPARSVLMTGLHTGHTTVRGNFGTGADSSHPDAQAGRVPLRDEDITVAEVLKAAGYVTGMTGKWGLGEPGSSGLPNHQGFDEWFGFLNQQQAHNHFNDHVWLNKEKYPVPGNENGQKNTYTHDLFTDFAINFIERHAGKSQPFFLYIPYLLPHDAYEIPEINPLYADKDWSEDEKVYASMVSALDRDMGRIRSVLEKHGVLGNTLIIFTTDNGAANRWEGVFDSSGPLRGRKRDVYEGGIRVPLIVSMPGTVPQGTTNHTVGYFADFLPTFSAIAGQSYPGRTDGVNLKDVLLANESITEDRTLYWEFHEQGGKQAVRKGNWKGLRLDVHEHGFHNDVELYDLTSDPYETIDVSAKHPEIVERIKKIMEQEHETSESFPFNFETDIR